MEELDTSTTKVVNHVVLIILSCGYHALVPSVSEETPAGGHCPALEVLLHKGADKVPAARLLPSYGLHQLSWCAGPCPHISFILGDLENLLAMVWVDVSSWRSCCLVLPLQKLQKLKTTISHDEGGMANSMWSPQVEPFLIRGCLANCLSFLPVVCPICTHLVKLIHSHYFFLTRQVDVIGVSLQRLSVPTALFSKLK